MQLALLDNVLSMMNIMDVMSYCLHGNFFNVLYAYNNDLVILVMIIGNSLAHS